MQNEPTVKRTVAFFDGQNLYHHAKAAFGYQYPNYSPFLLATRVCKENGFNLHEIRFYTGVPSEEDRPGLRRFWGAKLLAMSRLGITTISRPLRRRYDDETGAVVLEEKGIDVRIAIDIMRLVRKNALDVVLLFSQDQDFTEVASEIVDVAREQGRWIKIASAYPESATASSRRGVINTDWIRIGKDLYDSCIDSNDYRGKG